MSKTLVIGAAFVDVLMDVPKLPTTGEDISGHLRANIVGGSAFNVYGAIKYAGQDADLICASWGRPIRGLGIGGYG